MVGEHKPLNSLAVNLCDRQRDNVGGVDGEGREAAVGLLNAQRVVGHVALALDVDGERRDGLFDNAVERKVVRIFGGRRELNFDGDGAIGGNDARDGGHDDRGARGEALEGKGVRNILAVLEGDDLLRACADDDVAKIDLRFAEEEFGLRRPSDEQEGNSLIVLRDAEQPVSLVRVERLRRVLEDHLKLLSAVDCAAHRAALEQRHLRAVDPLEIVAERRRVDDHKPHRVADPHAAAEELEHARVLFEGGLVHPALLVELRGGELEMHERALGASREGDREGSAGGVGERADEHLVVVADSDGSITERQLLRLAGRDLAGRGLDGEGADLVRVDEAAVGIGGAHRKVEGEADLSNVAEKKRCGARLKDLRRRERHRLRGANNGVEGGKVDGGRGLALLVSLLALAGGRERDGEVVEEGCLPHRVVAHIRNIEALCAELRPNCDWGLRHRLRDAAEGALNGLNSALLVGVGGSSAGAVVGREDGGLGDDPLIGAHRAVPLDKRRGVGVGVVNRLHCSNAAGELAGGGLPQEGHRDGLGGAGE